MKRLSFVMIALAASACGSQRAATPEIAAIGTSSVAAVAKGLQPAWVDGTLPAPYDASTHLMVVGRGDTPEAAQADARQQMQQAVLGPPEDRPFLTVPDDLQDFAFAPATEQFTTEGVGAFVRLIAQRVFIVDRLKQWSALMGRDALKDDPVDAFRSGGQAVVDAGEHLQALAATLAYYRAGSFVCARQAEITTTPCTETFDIKVVRDAIAEFGNSIRVQEKWSGGVPYRDGIGPLADVTVRATVKPRSIPALPLTGLPVAFKGPDAEAKATTNDDGLAHWATKTIEPSSKVAVRIDAETLLGPDASLWAKLPVLEVGYRPVDATSVRLAMFLQESTSGDNGLRGMTARIATAGLTKFSVLAPALRSMVPKKGAPTPEQLRALAAAANGQFDVLVVGEMHSQFASKLGRRTVWHEAQGTVTVYDVWSGATLGPLTATERAKGLGENKASQNALDALGRKLGHDLLKLLAEHFRAGAATAAR